MRCERLGVVKCTKFLRRLLAVSDSADCDDLSRLLVDFEESTSANRVPGRGCAASRSRQYVISPRVYR